MNAPTHLATLQQRLNLQAKSGVVAMTFKTLLTVSGPNRGEGDLCEQVGAHRDSLADVAVSLEHHGIKARRELIVGEADGGRLLTFARDVNPFMSYR
jgi:hypothetical protein